MNTCEFLRGANAIADQLRAGRAVLLGQRAGEGAAMSAARPGRGSSLALCSAGNSSPIGARVHRVLKGWTVDGGHLPPRM